jgi:hypothetical protein
VAPQAAASTEPMKEKTPRVDWAELLRRTFDFDVFACVRCGGRLKGVGVREGSTRGARDSEAPGPGHCRCEASPGARATPGSVVLRRSRQPTGPAQALAAP